MADDFMRNHLVIKFKCVECGEMLKLSYDIPKGSNYIEGEPTGAAMVGQVIGVHPCEGCLAPARKLQEAVKTLITTGK